MAVQVKANYNSGDVIISLYEAKDTMNVKHIIISLKFSILLSVRHF